MKKGILLLAFVGFVVQSAFSQGQFGGKIAVLDPTNTTTWYNTTSQTCDGAGVGNLSTGNPTAINAYVGDKFYLGGNVLTYGFGSSGDKGELRWSYYVVGGTQSWSSYYTLPYANSTVCGGGSNKKYEFVPIVGTNTIQATATGSYRLDVDLRGNNNGATYTVYTSGNYIPFTVNSLGNPTSCTATISGTMATLGWTKFTGGSTAYNVMIVRYAKDATPTAPTNTSSYALNASIGTGTVVYATNSGVSTTNTVTASTDYDYYFYSENWSYYSSGVKVTALAPLTPTIGSFSTANNNGTTTSGYVGTTVTVSGTNLGSITTLKVGGSSGTSISSFTKNSTTITFTATAGLSGTIYVSDGTNSSTSSSSYVDLGYVSSAATDWNTASTWLGGAVPTASSNVTIANNITLNAAATNTSFNNLTINASSGITFGASGAVTVNGTLTNGGSVVMTSGGTLTMGSGSTLANGSATFTGGTGTVSFSGAGTVTGTIAFTNLTLNGAVTLSTASTINGNLQINSGGSVVTNAPIYGVSSTLIYNQTGSPTFGTEWTGNSATAGSGVPNNVTIQNSTTVNLPTSNRGLAGSLNISSGALALNATSGDLYLAGNWTNSGTFTPNNRAVFFNGSTDQTVTKSGGETFDWFIVNKSTGSLVLGSNITINSSKNVTFTNGTITLGNYNFQLNSGATIVTPTSAKYFITNGTGYLIQNVSNSEVTFPVGTATVYAPAYLTQASTAENLSVRVASTITNAPVGDTNALVNLQWTLNESTVGSNNITTKFQWNTAQEGSTFNRAGSVQIGRYLSGSYTISTATEAGANPYTASAASMTSTISGTQFVVGNISAFAAVPAITGVTSSLPASSSTQTYKGATITVTGTNLGSVSTVKLGGSGGTTITGASIGSTQITFIVPDATSTGTIYVSDGTNNNTSSASFANLGFITNAATDWNTGSTWLGGSVPTASSTTTIANSITLNAAATNNPSSITVNASSGITFGVSGSITASTVTNSGTVDMTSGGILTVVKSASGTSTVLTNTGTWSSGTGSSKIIFTGAPSSGDAVHAVSGTINFNNITINKTSGSSNVGASFGSGSTISGTLEIGTGGYVSTAPPASFYNSSAILKFNQGSGATYDVNAGDYSWSTSQVPQNITISSGTVNLNADRTASGNLIINGGALVLNSNTPNLTIQGDWTRSSGSFTAGTGTVTLSGASDGTVSVTGGATMNNLVISKTSGGKAIIDCNLTTSVLTISTSAILTVNAGKQLTVSTTMSNIGTLNLLSDNTNGTATITTPATITNSSATYNIYQYLSVARNWYMSSPVSGASSLPTVDTGSLTFYSYPENDSNQATGANGYAAGAVWNTVSSGTFALGKGYIVSPSAVSTVKFTGTSLNTNDQTISGLTYTTANPKHGFNLIGNPYPSYVNVLPSITANANLEATVWYRTRDTNTTPLYHFETVNATSGVGTNASGTGRVTGYIPPMQAFWIRTKVDNQSITLSNTNRSHSKTDVTMTGYPNTPTTPLKAPSVKSQVYPLVGLNVSNGSYGDETIVMFATESSNGLDAYDSGKMTNANASIPEIYTVVDGQQLAINSMTSIPYDTEIPLGFTTGEAGTNFSIKASEISNFAAGTKVLLKDTANVNSPIDISDGSSYVFSSGITNSSTRFAVIFKSASVYTGTIGNANQNVWISVNGTNQIVVNGASGTESTVAVYNAVGQKLVAKTLTSTITTLNNPLQSGVYFVTVTNAGKSVTKKVILN